MNNEDAIRKAGEWFDNAAVVDTDFPELHVPPAPLPTMPVPRAIALPLLPYRSRLEGTRVFVLPHGHPRAAWLCEINPYRPDACAVADGLATAATLYPELRAALESLLLVVRHALHHPHAGTASQLRRASAAATAVLNGCPVVSE